MDGFARKTNRDPGDFDVRGARRAAVCGEIVIVSRIQKSSGGTKELRLVFQTQTCRHAAPDRRARPPCQTATRSAVALLPGLKQPWGALQKHRVTHEHDRDPEPHCLCRIRVIVLNKINAPSTKLYRTWLTRQ